MKKVLAVAVLLLAGVTYAQTAKVIVLEPRDAEQARLKWDALQKAQNDWNQFQADINQKYTMEKADQDNMRRMYFQNSNPDESCRVSVDLKGKIVDWSNCNTFELAIGSHRDGWYWGFTFAEDFKSIVAKPRPPVSNNGWDGMGGLYFKPSGSITVPGIIPNWQPNPSW